MTNPTAAMLVIGDEILSGRTRDTNTNHLATRLTETGIDLREARVVSDDRDAIVAALRALSEAWDHVFTSGGIGPTHDDITADAVGAAFGAAGGRARRCARACWRRITKSRAATVNAARLRMARIPDGATLIDNPVSAAPGFTLGNVHVMAGVPKIFQAMVESVLPTADRRAAAPRTSIRVDRGEGDIAGPLADLAAAAPRPLLRVLPVPDGGWPLRRERRGAWLGQRAP